jgi:hypothetical protein
MCVYMFIYIYIFAHIYTHTHAHTHTRARTHAHTYMYVSALHTCDVFPSALDRAWLGSQAFGSASAFNANIGAWNTARVTDLTTV